MSSQVENSSGDIPAPGPPTMLKGPIRVAFESTPPFLGRRLRGHDYFVLPFDHLLLGLDDVLDLQLRDDRAVPIWGSSSAFFDAHRRVWPQTGNIRAAGARL